jgi:hypothetical protein
LKRIHEVKQIVKQVLAETIEEKGSLRTVTMPKSERRIRTLDDLIEYCEIDTSIWEVDHWTCNKWESPAKDSNSDIQIAPLFQVKAYLKKKIEVCNARAEIESMLEEAKKSMPRYPAYIPNINNKQHMLEISIPDLHMGKFAWAAECGVGQSYDLKIAEERFWKATEDFIHKASVYDLECIHLCIGNDLLHIDNRAGLTTGGTQMDFDSRYQKIYTKTREMLVAQIERLMEIAPIRVIQVVGNHDTNSVFTLGEALQCWFHSADNVEIMNGPQFRKVVKWGSNMLGYTHGNEEKIDRLPQIFAAEFPEMWGATKFRECKIGHFHGLGVKDFHGFTVRWLRSLCSTDAWHSKSGFVGNVQGAESFVWDRDNGMIAQHYYNIER